MKEKAKVFTYYGCDLILQHQILCQKVLCLYLLQGESAGTHCAAFGVLENKFCCSVSWLDCLCPLSALQGREVVSLCNHVTLISIPIMAVATH